MNRRQSLAGPRRICWAVAIALAAAAPVLGATAPEIRIDPTTLYFGANAARPGRRPGPPRHPSTSASRPSLSAALREKAAKGPVRVIVQLSTAFAPEGQLAAVQAIEQRQAIGALQDTVLGKLAGRKVEMLGRYQHIPFLALAVDADGLDLLSRLPEVAGIQEDVLQKPQLASANAVIGAGVAWSLGLTGAGQTIAVLDTGVDKTHPYFSSGAHNKVVSEACYSSNIPSDYPYDVWTSLCPGGVAESVAPGSGANCPTTLSSDCQHGTHVAGIAAGNDGAGPNFGTARDADLISIQVFSAQCYNGGNCYIGAWLSDELQGAGAGLRPGGHLQHRRGQREHRLRRLTPTPTGPIAIRTIRRSRRPSTICGRSTSPPSGPAATAPTTSTLRPASPARSASARPTTTTRSRPSPRPARSWT